MSIISSRLQDKKWRMSQPWYKGGKKNECELFQRLQLEMITKKKCVKTNTRINFEKNIMISHYIQPCKLEDGFDYTEDFDGYQTIKNTNFKLSYDLYYNLKFVCDKGGAQTRTLQMVYKFIDAQIKFLKTNEKTEPHPFFINILDGDGSNERQRQFEYVLKRCPLNLSKYIFCGDMKRFEKWYISTFPTELDPIEIKCIPV